MLKLGISAISIWLAGTLFATGAQATYGYHSWDPNAEAGTYGPVALGEDIELDACGSSFYYYYNPSYSHSLCDLTDLSAFTLAWKAYTPGDWQWLGVYSGANASSGLNVTQATGAGTFFDEAGTYYIGLYVRVQNNTWVPLPGGGHAYTAYYNRDFDWSNAFAITDPISVPEPAPLLLLLPALAWITRRQKRLKAHTP